eukprot:3010693-Amphidinium_carterae.1
MEIAQGWQPPPWPCAAPCAQCNALAEGGPLVWVCACHRTSESRKPPTSPTPCSKLVLRNPMQD